MKKNILLICLSLLALISCTNNNEASYSCDPTINSWVKSNIKQIQSMKRAEWLNLDEAKKKPAYRALNPEERYNFWLDKLSEVLRLNWTDDEKSHIAELYNWAKENPQFFGDVNIDSKEFADFEKFMYVWSESGKSKFGWNKQIIGAIVMSGNTMLDIKGKLKTNIPQKSKRFKVAAESAPGSLCGCSTSSDWCDAEQTCSASSTCKQYRGCGWLLAYFCNGDCNW